MLLLLFSAFALLVSTGAKAVDPVFAPVPQEMKTQLDKQRLFVSSLVANSFPGERLTGTTKDFQLVQRILDANLIPKSHAWGLQALGVVFGDVLVVAIPGLAWYQVKDEYGTDPTLRYRATTIQINALTTLSKRVERNEKLNVEQLATQFSQFVATQAKLYK